MTSFGVLQVRLLGDPCLRAKSKPVEVVGPAERMLIAAMKTTVKEQKGIGLAAPQVGVNTRIFVIATDSLDVVVINPKIIKVSGGEVMEEGCLSIPHLLVDVKRPTTIWAEFTDEYNRTMEARLSGLEAKVFQHETDHLNGVLIIDYLTPAERKKVLARIKDGIYQLKEKKNDAASEGKI